MAWSYGRHRKDKSYEAWFVEEDRPLERGMKIEAELGPGLWVPVRVGRDAAFPMVPMFFIDLPDGRGEAVLQLPQDVRFRIPQAAA